MASDNVPIGTIVAWAGPSNLVPTGWLICNGDPIYQRQFPDLCAIIQDYWGPIDAVSGQHILPDLRALFLRGVSSSRNDAYADPDQNTRQSNNGRPNEVGSLQQDAFQGHWHDQRWAHPPCKGDQPDNADGGNERNGFYPNSLQITNPIQDDKNSGVPRTSSETRAKNAYVYYIIKAIQS